jgi:hypothetical protein
LDVLLVEGLDVGVGAAACDFCFVFGWRFLVCGLAAFGF